MITASTFNTDVLVHGAQASGNFSIAANGKAFKILIDGLYSNKIQAIIRELCSNAYDAQIAAGRGDLAFELQLPNLLDPTFSVRDYGTSLSHNNVMGLYTTVFQSTKEDSNLAIGKFGLGSKTPFAYTDSFTVTAFMAGTKRVYGAYINVQGIPQISLMASEDTSEPDGLMVSFPVNTKDCDRFKTEAERVIEGFDATPNVRGATLRPINRGKIVHSGTHHKFYEGNGSARAKQGCVIYPIDLNALPSLSLMEQYVLKANILIDFPIGDLDITPSRETLSYDDATIKNIVGMANRISAEVLADYEKQFKLVRTMHEARCFVARIKKSGIKVVDSWSSSLLFNGKRVSVHSSMSRDRMKQVYCVGLTHIASYDIQYDKAIRFSDKAYDKSWDVNDDVMFVTEDVSSGKSVTFANAKIRENLGSHKSVIWIKNYGATPKQWRSFVKLLGYPPKFYNLNTMTLPPREKTTYYEAAPRIAKNEIRAFTLKSDTLEMVDHVFDLNALDDTWSYIVSHKGGYLADNSVIENYVGGNIREFITDTSKIIVIKRKDLPKIFKTPVKNFFEGVRNDLRSRLDFKMFNEHDNVGQEMDHWIKSYHSQIISAVKGYDKETSFKKVLDFLNKYGTYNVDSFTENNDLIYKWSRLVPAQEFRDALDKHPADFSGDKCLSYWVERLAKEYPLLKQYVEAWNATYFVPVLSECIEYINLLDNKRNI